MYLLNSSADEFLQGMFVPTSICKQLAIMPAQSYKLVWWWISLKNANEKCMKLKQNTEKKYNLKKMFINIFSLLCQR